MDRPRKKERLRSEIIRELTIKARFLSYICIASIIVFSIGVMKLYPNWRASKLLFFFALLMEFFSFGLFIYTRRILGVLRSDPSDQKLAECADFLSMYYFPKFLFRKKRNPFIISDDGD